VNDDLPRYTWVGGPAEVRIMRRVGIYGQEELFRIAVYGPYLGTEQGKAAARLLPVAANAVCDALSELDDGQSETSVPKV
jgi:hypothetical protein